MYHPQVVPSQIFNYCLNLNIDGHTRPKIVPGLLLQVSARELHKSLVSDTVDVGVKEAGDAENNTIISYPTLCSLLPPQFKKYQPNTRSCVVVNVAYL